VALNLRDPNDYFEFVRRVGRIGYEVSTGDMSRAELSVGLWIPSVRADAVAAELGGLDLDMRRAAAWQPWASPDYMRRLPPPLRYYLEESWEGMGYLGWPWPLMGLPTLEPIDASEGGLDVLAARQGDSLDIDFQAIGLVLGMLVDVPAAFLVVRALFRRIPLRIVWRPANTSNQERQVVEASPSGRDEIEAGRLVRRTTLRYSDGSELIEEEYASTETGAA
jgi:hypothetical protein